MSTTEILYGFGGLLAGAIFTGLGQAITRWQERRLAKRAAARAVFSDLHDSKDGLRQAMENEDWDELPPPLREDWIRYRDDLSRGMSWNDFHRIGGAFTELLILHRMKSQRRSFDRERCEEALERFLLAEPIAKEAGMSSIDKWWIKRSGARMSSDDHL